MKFFLILLLPAVFAFTSCKQNNQQKAEKIARSYLDSVNDPKSYESIAFTKLEKYENSFISDPGYTVLQDSVSSKATQISHLAIKIDYPALYDVGKIKRQIVDLKQDSTLFAHKSDSLVNGFKPKQIGWRFEHSYRAKNALGALTVHKTVFLIDTAITKVIMADEIK